MSAIMETGSMGQICWSREGVVWQIRHCKDRGAEDFKLRRLVELEELEALVRYDAEGRYRPLHSEGNLVAGWIYEAKGESAWREALEVIYPGLWGNAEAWGEGKLRVDEWAKALARQTERVRRKVEGCKEMPQRIVDQHCHTRCLKCVLWAGDEPAISEGQTPMLCTGPCGVFWAALEG